MPSWRNLIPIPRIDKNGRITIRHMRSGKDSAQGARNALPAVSITSSIPTAKARAESLWESIKPLNTEFSSEKMFIKEFVNLAEKYPRLAATTERTFTTGADSSRQLSMAITENFLSLLRKPGFMHEDFDAIFNKQLLERWNACNVGEETGLNGTLEINVPSYVISVPEDLEYDLDDAAWRGYAAARFAFEAPGARGNEGDIVDFIYWAGEQDDLRTVIDLARDRGTMDPKVLQPLMEAIKDNHSDVLQSGLL